MLSKDTRNKHPLLGAGEVRSFCAPMIEFDALPANGLNFERSNASGFGTKLSLNCVTKFKREWITKEIHQCSVQFLHRTRKNSFLNAIQFLSFRSLKFSRRISLLLGGYRRSPWHYHMKELSAAQGNRQQTCERARVEYVHARFESLPVSMGFFAMRKGWWRMRDAQKRLAFHPDGRVQLFEIGFGRVPN